MSPTVFREAGFRLYFFSREEERKHVHASHAAGEAKFRLEPAIELATSSGLNANKLAAALELAGDTSVKSTLPGKSTSPAEVTNISAHGFWLLLSGPDPARAEQELFLSFEKFPWFRAATVAQITQVERPSPNHLYWPALDIDLAVESIHNPERFPLVSK